MNEFCNFAEIAKRIEALWRNCDTACSLRSGTSKAEKDIVDLLFKSLDALADLIEDKAKGKAEKVKVAPLVERFEEIISVVPKGETEPIGTKRPELKLDNIDSSAPSFGKFQTVRVPLTQLDNLMDLAGELAINRIRLFQIAQTIEDSALEETVAQFSRLASQLQDQMMQVRLVPLRVYLCSLSQDGHETL